ncbi:F-BAR and double SH3 domains protein 2 [Varanus komodoensis]|nr:F-BAR and double SH3 domains protein 2 [Varanus komodoensis]
MTRASRLLDSSRELHKTTSLCDLLHKLIHGLLQGAFVFSLWSECFVFASSLMQVLDGNVYDHLKDYLMAFSRTELEICQAVQSTFQFLLETSSRVVRDYNFQLFLQENSVFHRPQSFQFQPCDSDTSFSAVQLVDVEPSPVRALRMTLVESRQLESETGTTEEHSLNKEARKWATRVAREHKNIIHSQRTLEELECHGPVVSEQSRAELEQKMDEARENIRQAEIIKLKAEARLDLLKQIGVSVDTWLKSAMNQVMEELENERWAGLTTAASNGSSHLVQVRFCNLL